MTIHDTSNTTFQIAADLVNNSSRNIFLTGKAGTGKTTFLKYIKENCVKEVAVVAPTGVAAINAGGTTIHSFFQLPFTPFVPIAANSNSDVLSKHSLLSRMRLSKERRNLLVQLELLIIDEISMVRCDTLDAIDTVLRHYRHRYHEPFGGIQVLLIGDMFQLPPVVPREEWTLLSPIYKSPFFFNSKVIEEFPPVYVEFDKIYRQNDEQFIHLLNQVRNNDLDDGGMELLKGLCQPQFQVPEKDPYIILTTHNFKADKINEDALSGLKEKLFSFEAALDGDFNEKAYPAEKLLKLKVGAQVMFIKNDTEKERRYFNGKIGVVSQVGDDKILVQCKDQPTPIEVKKDTWENIRYTLDKVRQKVEEDVIGSFKQYPLRLAWAITIHKSQGLTFEKAIIDAGDAFAPGQAYVALSRCTGLKGLILKSHISASSLFTDHRIVEFARQCQTGVQLQQELDVARQKYQQQILISLFEYNLVVKEVADLVTLVMENSGSPATETIKWLEDLQGKVQSLQNIGQKFIRQIQPLFQPEQFPNESQVLQQRVSAAAEYFVVQLESALVFLKQSPVVTDSKQYASEYNEALKSIYVFLAQKQNILEGCKKGFDLATYQQRKKSFQLTSFQVNAYAGAVYKSEVSPHPLLHQQVRKLRDAICERNNLPIYIVAGSKTLDELARYLPQNFEELEKISGFGKAKIEKYGQQFLEIITGYCSHHQLTSSISEKIPKRERREKTQDISKPDTKNESFKLYKQGRTVAEIAIERKLVIQTIQGHLAHYVFTGDIKVEELVTKEKIMLIKPLVESLEGESITPIKEKLGNDISFGEIRIVMAWMDLQKSKVV